MEVCKSVSDESNEFYRFQVFQGDEQPDGKVRKTNTVGMSYLRNGQSVFTLRLWTFVFERYYLIPSKEDSARYLIMTREPNKNPESKNKYFWNIVGNGVANSVHGYIKMNFDLFEAPIYMNIHPETSAHSVRMAEPEFLPNAA